MQNHRRTLVLGGLMALAARPGLAQPAYPARPIKFVVPFPPGGGTDSLTRLIAQKLTDTFKWTIVVDNKPGAGGNLALDTAAKAVGDGYTLVMAQTDNVVLNPLLYSKLTYDPIKDLQSVGTVASGAAVLVVRADSPYKTLQEVVAAARAQPDKLTFASPGIGTVAHLVLELWKKASGIQITHVPYRGIANALPDLLAGQVDMYMGSVPTMLAQIKGGKVRALGVTDASRSPVLPDVPTFAEAGVRGAELSSVWGVMAPASTPIALVEQLNRALNTVLQQPETRERILATGAVLLGGTARQMADQYAADRARLAPVVRDSRITLE